MSTKSRRELLATAGRGFGAIAASSLLPLSAGPLSSKPPHQPARAKAVIYLHMHGGVSHVDTWDPKPELTRLSGQTLPASFVKGLKTSRIDFTKALARGSAWPFRKYGQSGLEISSLFPNIASHADGIALVRSCHGDAFDHSSHVFACHGFPIPGPPLSRLMGKLWLGNRESESACVCGHDRWRNEVWPARLRRGLPARCLSGDDVPGRKEPRARSRQPRWH